MLNIIKKIEPKFDSYKTNPTNKPTKIITHHTGGSDANPNEDTSNHTFESVVSYHKSKGWDTIGYHFFIEKDGSIYQGRPVEMHGAHTVGENKTSIGICLSGNFDSTMPSEAQISSLRGLLGYLCDTYHIDRKAIFPHRKYANKTCYGNKLSDTWAMELLNEKCSISDFSTEELFNELSRRLFNK